MVVYESSMLIVREREIVTVIVKLKMKNKQRKSVCLYVPHGIKKYVCKCKNIIKPYTGKGEKSQYKKKKNTRTIIFNKLTNDNITTNDQHNTSIYIYIYIYR